MADVREAILSRIVALLGALPNIDQVSRNVLTDDDGNLHRITVMEGEEIGSEADPVHRPPTAPRVIHMQPQIIISAAAKSKDIGGDLSIMRGQVIQAIATDSALSALTMNNWGGRYIGMESDLAFGRTMLGQMALKFQFTYALRPDQF
jgi:hypothetical protein